jgi:inorganic pyrophosphatase
MGTGNLEGLATWDEKSGALNVVIETPKGSRNKLAYDPDAGAFTLRKVLPRGLVFPFDFGFIPSTAGQDGDPLDVLLLLDEPLPTGCLVPARLLGVIEAEQTEKGQTERNDRLIAVAVAGQEQSGTKSLKDLGEDLLGAIEHFFVSYNEMAGKQFRPLGRYGPRRAEKLVRVGEKRFHKEVQEEESASAVGQGPASDGEAE